jgi:hypothetical protein
MSNVTGAILLFVICSMPTAAVVLWIRQQGRQYDAVRRVPFKELRRRPAGESLRVKLEGFDQRTQEETMYLVLVSVLFGVIAYFGRKFDPVFWVSAFVVSVMFAWVMVKRICYQLEERCKLTVR